MFYSKRKRDSKSKFQTRIRFWPILYPVLVFGDSSEGDVIFWGLRITGVLRCPIMRDTVIPWMKEMTGDWHWIFHGTWRMKWPLTPHNNSDLRMFSRILSWDCRRGCGHLICQTLTTIFLRPGQTDQQWNGSWHQGVAKGHHCLPVETAKSFIEVECASAAVWKPWSSLSSDLFSIEPIHICFMTVMCMHHGNKFTNN